MSQVAWRVCRGCIPVHGGVRCHGAGCSPLATPLCAGSWLCLLEALHIPVRGSLAFQTSLGMELEQTTPGLRWCPALLASTMGDAHPDGFGCFGVLWGGPSEDNWEEGGCAEERLHAACGGMDVWGAVGCCGPLCSWGAGIIRGGMVQAIGQHSKLGKAGMGYAQGVLECASGCPREMKVPSERWEHTREAGRRGEGQPWPDAATPPSSSALHINANALA